VPRLCALAAAGAAAATAGAAYAAEVPTAQLYGPVLCRLPPAGRRLALTYDDGPNPRHTPALLELLAAYDARATFFVIGRWAEREPGLLREIAAAGHAIGNHTYSHPSMPLLRAAQVRDELRRCRRAVEAAGVAFASFDGAALMRPPYGRRRPGTLRAVRDAGYVPVTWSVSGYDWRPREPAARIGRRCVRATDGDVILLHDGSDAEPAADRSRTVLATRAALEHHRERGARFVTIAEALGPEATG
jgi:peptidoglycan/xylan/chitin deacetylase (PgdA/CDA1 family)